MRFLTIVAAAAVAAAAVPAAADIVSNGSFETLTNGVGQLA